MAIRPDDAATLAKGVQELYAEAETTLLQRIAAALASGRDAPDWAETKLLGIQALSRQADGILADLAKNVPGAVERAVGIAYNRGIATAGGDLTGAGLAAGAFGEVQPTGAAAAIVSDTLARLTPMQFQIRRAVTDVYQQVVTQVAAQTVLGTVTRREASAKILTRLASQGVTGFRDVAGRQWAMSSYAEMAARTSASNAMLQGHTDRISELGIDTVIVSNAPEDCELCRPFEGKVLSLSGRTTGRLRDGKTVVASLSQAKGAGLYHPNCRHSHSVYLPGITKGPETDTADPEGNALRVKQRAYERRIRELKRQDVMAQEFGGPAAKQARAKLNAKTAEFRDWRTAHDRKNLSYRTSIATPKPETDFPVTRTTAPEPVKRRARPSDLAPVPDMRAPRTQPDGLGRKESRQWAEAEADRLKYASQRQATAEKFRDEYEARQADPKPAKQGSVQKFTTMHQLDDLHGAPEPVGTARDAANPRFSTDPDYQMNCTRVVTAYELRRRGYDVQASIATDQNTVGAYTKGWWRTADYQVPEELEFSTRAAMESTMDTWPDGARGIISVQREWGAGHTFNAEKVDGKIVYVEAQNAGADPELNFRQMNKMFLFRVDELIPTHGAATAVEKRG